MLKTAIFVNLGAENNYGVWVIFTHSHSVSMRNVVTPV